ncbi:cell division protein FtsQ/DivIB [Kingella negevensis]|uniref:cell division protein FtsQ/DivIB n=1 Tax=Kingella negevensis TaxID=1522312 RepID=UPI00254CA00D|nr:cell division protein FtsQ/DivIB [Kingella negevensis]MDK4692380.1 cell division protein FtsQ/DivIB [Kingella negevensis]MDK4696519.1 cell division protein FtsQ/DivIB [Kingella negevensis]MDK4698682.1 cell division protein FtsQ/DivIB [Kingella negevensis]MDK4707459.1 cell division protein FtsQ/DivIB [Kingella negevensis]MDK4710065.1 cell division protein FtsQ/DivIB [Kingella negevensis]
MKIVFYLILLLILLTGIFWLPRSSYFQIGAINIVAENGGDQLKHASKRRVFESVRPYLTGSFFHVNVHDAQRAAESVNWVKHARVDRIPPSVIKITVEEYAPVARWVREGYQAGLITAEGQIFQAAYNEELPEFDGDVTELPMMLEQYRLLNEQLKPLRLKILRLQYSSRAAWSMMLDNGIELRLGTQNTHTRMARFVEYYPSKLAWQANNVDYVDMRYPDAFAVRLSENLPEPEEAEQKQTQPQEKQPEKSAKSKKTTKK